VRGGFRPLVNPGTPVSEIDIEGTREYRKEVRRQLVLREHLQDVFARAPVGERGVQITSLDPDEETIEGGWMEATG
jgi:hypothetical protein